MEGQEFDMQPGEGGDDEFPQSPDNDEQPFEGEENEEGADEGDVDQYFDDAGDIGYLPADHVTSLLIFNSLTFVLASHEKTSTSFGETAHRRA